jgi:hypothetical protein
MKFQTQQIDAKCDVQTLNWLDGDLVDFADGGRVYGLDGSITPSALNWGGPKFDLCVLSRSGRFAALCQRFGTKGLVLDVSTPQPKLLREINRSYYCSNAYEYPVTFICHEGRELLVHCPDEYCRLEIEDVAVGCRVLDAVQSQARNPADIFHSRLAVSPSGRRLISAGWVWHPFDTVAMFDLQAVWEQPSCLDKVECPGLQDFGEVSSAVFLGDDSLLVSENSDQVTYGEGEQRSQAKLRQIYLPDGTTKNQFNIDLAAGVMMPLGDQHVVTFYQHPQVFDLMSGQLIASWPEIDSGKDTGCITGHLPKAPAMALDPQRKRFAVANGKEVIVISAIDV